MRFEAKLQCDVCKKVMEKEEVFYLCFRKQVFVKTHEDKVCHICEDCFVNK